MFTFLFTVNVKKIFQGSFRQMRHLLDLWKFIWNSSQSMNSMCKLQNYAYKNTFYLFIIVYVFIFYRYVSARDVMEKLIHAFMNWDMGKFVQMSCEGVGYHIYVNLHNFTSSWVITNCEIVHSLMGNNVALFLVCINGIEEVAIGFILFRNEELNAWELELVRLFKKNTW